MRISVDTSDMVILENRMSAIITGMRGTQFLQGMRDAVTTVVGDARLLAPVDSGRLKNSIIGDVLASGRTVQGVIGSNMSYAPYMELGTGVFVGRPAYFPPPSALSLWASRHGFSSGYIVALAIWKKGGLEGRFFLQKALKMNQKRIAAILDRKVSTIING